MTSSDTKRWRNACLAACRRAARWRELAEYEDCWMHTVVAREANYGEHQRERAEKAERERDAIRTELRERAEALDEATRERDKAAEALAAAAQSLANIAELGGKNGYLEAMSDVRGYAYNRAGVALAAIKAIRARQAKGGE